MRTRHKHNSVHTKQILFDGIWSKLRQKKAADDTGKNISVQDFELETVGEMLGSQLEAAPQLAAVNNRVRNIKEHHLESVNMNSIKGPEMKRAS